MPTDAPGGLLPGLLALIELAPEPVAFTLGPLPVYWYGICYAVGLALAYMVLTRGARRAGLDAGLVDNGIIVVGVAALAGGRAYHVIDQWAAYADRPLAIILPPYTGLGVYGGILTGALAVIWLVRHHRQPFWRWADVIAPALFTMQAVGRWGNFFNQELYGPPTDLPWAILIDCRHRLPEYACGLVPAGTGFHPLFLYESLSGAAGALVLLWLARRRTAWLRPGDLVLLFFAWYAAVRLALETLRVGNWTVLGGIPTASLISAAVLVGALAILAWRHRPGAAAGDAPEGGPAAPDGSAAPPPPVPDDAPRA